MTGKAAVYLVPHCSDLKVGKDMMHGVDEHNTSSPTGTPTSSSVVMMRTTQLTSVSCCSGASNWPPDSNAAAIQCEEAQERSEEVEVAICAVIRL